MIGFSFFMLFFGATLSAETVKYAAVIYRHGDRTPVSTYPKDPWRNESLWPVKFGELTNIGKRQHYALGQWLRKRYSNLVSDWFDPTEIYVRSTDVDRTLMSAQANLAGFYPPKGTSVWSNELLWQPIPVHTVPEKEDEVLSMKKPCPVYDKEYEKYIHSKPFKQRLNKYQDLMDYLTVHTGRKIESYDDIIDIYSTLSIEKYYNFTLPNWTHSVFPDKMAEPGGYSFRIATSTPALARLKIGPLFKQIITNMYHVISKKKAHPIKLSMYSAHDYTVGNFLNALGLYNGVAPVYTATVLLELIYDNTTLSNAIRISYRNSTDIVEPYVLNIPHCGETCPLPRFIKLYENLLSVKWDYECGKKFQPLLGISFFIGLGIFVIIYVGHKVYFTRVFSRQNYDLGYSHVQTVAISPGRLPPVLGQK